ncbi:MAG: SPOR domain-containing protein [Dokdonia sp.]|jgi:hypothetical protein|nr:translation initiation factor IF-2 [Cytophagaceae bacterium]
MKYMPRFNRFFLLVFSLFSFAFAKAQNGTTTVIQNPKIEQLIALKADMSIEGELADRYKIQIFSGNLNSAQVALKKFLNKVGLWRGKITYETPNYKVWVGNFRNRLEADRALIAVKKEFPSAFIFKPER